MTSKHRGTKKTRGVLVLGEVLCDLFPPRPGVSFVDADALGPLLGGAPANVAVQLARLRRDVALVTAVGNDPLGARMRQALANEGVDVERVKERKGWRTGVTLVDVDADGERRFYPLADRRADLAVTADDVDERFVRRFAIVHTGTVSLRAAGPRAAHNAVVDAARAGGAIVSLDVNLRWGMYPSRAMLVAKARAALRRAHVVKATRDEARALGASTAEGVLDAGPRLAMITLGAAGAILANRRATVRVAAPRVRVVDTTGAGDAFVGAALAFLLERGAGPADLDELDERALADIGERGCAAGGAACTALGATTAMPRSRA